MVATSASSDIANQILQEFLSALKGDFTKIESLAKGLFYYLAAIQLVVSALWLAVKSDLMEAVGKLLQLAFVLGLFYTLVLFGGEWVPDIINGFISVGSSASGVTSLTPSSILSQGISIGFAIMDNYSRWGWLAHPFGSLLAVALMLIIVIIYALLAAEVTIILVKSYVLVALSGLMFTFGANETVRPIAMNYFKAVIGIGLQLLTLYLIMGVGINIGSTWATLIGQAAATHGMKPFLVVMAAVVVFYLVVKNVPAFVAGLSGVSGFRNYGDAAVGAVMTAGGVGANAAMNAARLGGRGLGAAGQTIRGGAHAVGTAREGMQAGMSFPAAAGQAAGQAGMSTLKSAKDSLMKDNPGMSFGQKANAHTASKRAQRAATEASSKSPPPPSDDFKPNDVKPT